MLSATVVDVSTSGSETSTGANPPDASTSDVTSGIASPTTQTPIGSSGTSEDSGIGSDSGTVLQDGTGSEIDCSADSVAFTGTESDSFAKDSSNPTLPPFNLDPFIPIPQPFPPWDPIIIPSPGGNSQNIINPDGNISHELTPQGQLHLNDQIQQILDEMEPPPLEDLLPPGDYHDPQNPNLA